MGQFRQSVYRPGRSSVRYTTIGSYTFSWSRGVLFGYTYGVGAPLISQFQNIFRRGVLMNDGMSINNGVIARDTFARGDDIACMASVREDA